MNIALFTSNHLRHKYIANKIAEDLSLKLIICEEKSDAIQNTSKYDDEDTLLLENHFKQRGESEYYFFKKYSKFPTNITVTNVSFGTLNTPRTLELLEEYNIDYILLFGTSIIKNIILDKYPLKIINLHLGLSPYYKGSGTNFFPIVNNEFECIGATIHLATTEVDAGSILHQFRSDKISVNDDIYSLGNKIILKAGSVYPHVINNYILGKIKPVKQQMIADSKVYKLKDFTPEALKKATTVIKNNFIVDYLKNETERLILKPIVTNYNE